MRSLQDLPPGDKQHLAGGGTPLYFAAKRALDLGGAALLLLLLSPALLLIAMAIRLDSPGPALFVQERMGSVRVGQAGSSVWVVRRFRVYKFRSMVHGADETVHREYIRAFARGATPAPPAGRELYKLSADPRVTRVGAFVRRTSLDELPQLLNVLRGEMSLVGPRPVPPYEFEAYQPWQVERMAALPGITGLWQVHGRGRVTFDEMVRMDVAYVRGQSLSLDLSILALTIPAVLSGRGAR